LSTRGAAAARLPPRAVILASLGGGLTPFAAERVEAVARLLFCDRPRRGGHATKRHGRCCEQRGKNGANRREGLPVTMWEGCLKEARTRSANTGGEEVPEPGGRERRKQGSGDLPQTVVLGAATNCGGGRCREQG